MKTHVTSTPEISYEKITTDFSVFNPSNEMEYYFRITEIQDNSMFDCHYAVDIGDVYYDGFEVPKEHKEYCEFIVDAYLNSPEKFVLGNEFDEEVLQNG